MSSKYEAVIEAYSFFMKEDDVIEVWSNIDSDYPESFIYVKPGSIRNRKEFDYEVMAWFSRNS